MTCFCFKCNKRDKNNDLTEPKWNNKPVHCTGCGKLLGYVNYNPDDGMNCSDCQSEGFMQHEKLKLGTAG